MYQNDPVKCLTGEVRLSHVHLCQPYANPNQANATPKYSCTLLIPKSDVATKRDLDAAIESAAADATRKKWGGVRPPIIQSVIHDGDGVRKDGTPFSPECKGHWVMTASCDPTKHKPQVVDGSNLSCQLSPEDIYSGMYGRVTVRFFGYLNSGNKGVGCGLQNVLKTRDGERLAGGSTAESDFAGLAGIGSAPAPAAPTVYTAPAQNINPITGLPM